MFLLLTLIITIPAFISLLNPWYFSMHDFQHIARLFLLDTGIHQGSLFPRWVDLLGFNFGYPLFNFYPPLIYYISEIFRLLGATYVWSIKSMIIAGYLVGAVGVYLLGRKLFSTNIAAVLAAALFTFFTYHATLVYVRGAFAEFWGMNLLPYAFLALELVRERKSLRSAVWFGVAFALIMLSHVFVGFPFVLLCGVYVLLMIPWEDKKIRFLVKTLLGGILGLGVSAFFWLPSMVERSYTLVDTILTRELASYRIHFVQPIQFWYSPWGYGGSGAGFADGMSFQLGKIHIVIMLASVLLFSWGLMRKKISAPIARTFGIYTILLLSTLFLATEYSRGVWDTIPQLQYLQFPWRMLSFTGLFISIVGAYAVDYMPSILGKRYRGALQYIFTLLIIGVLGMQYGKYFRPSEYIAKHDGALTSFQELAWKVSGSSFEFSPRGVPLKKSRYDTSIFDIEEKNVPKQSYQVYADNAQVTPRVTHFNEKTFLVESPQNTMFQLNTFYFPGWVATIDGAPVEINATNRYRLIRIQVPSGSHSLEFRFEDTPIRKTANVVSVLTVAGMILLLGVGQLKKRKA